MAFPAIARSFPFGSQAEGNRPWTSVESRRIYVSFLFFLAFSFLFFAVFFLFIPTFLSIPRMVFIYLFSPSALALSFVIDYDDDGDDDDDDDDDDVDDDVVVASPERHHLLFLDEPEPFVAKHTPTQSDRKTKPK